MEILKSLILGLIQGITEFLPVSSSAHLKFFKQLLGVSPEGNTTVVFDLACHMGTVVALIFFFRKDLLQLTRAQAGVFLIALAPLVPFYFLLKTVREAASAPSLLGLFLIATSLILTLGERLRLKNPLSARKSALWIGSMQAAALIPGISRSGSTISAARVLGWSASDAIRFSFMLSIPTVLGGMGLESMKLFFSAEPHPISFASCAVGFTASLGAGLLVLPKAFRFLEKGNLRPFAWYCLFAGIGISVYFLVNG